ncbi:MAG TPA: response regulator [Candidatus Krumholzibacteria bacterium]|nr:response regulator [Candidatus Krumholzibacteria bacterium]
MKTRVLIVDDHPTYRHLLIAAAESRGFRVLPPVERASDAIECFKREQPEVVILDLHLPGEVDAFALSEFMLDLAGNTRIVAASSFSESGLVDRAFQRGAHRCLRKPFHMDEAQRLFDHLSRELHPVAV